VSPMVDIEVEGGFLQLCKLFWGNRSGVGQVNGFIIYMRSFCLMCIFLIKR
jgi:hypothetical protein